MKIILDKEMSDYISRYFNCNIKELELDTNSENIKREFADFIHNMLEKRNWTTVRTPYKYDARKGKLSFYKYDQFDVNIMNEIGGGNE